MATDKPIWSPGMKQNRLEAKLHLPAGFEVLLTRFSREVIRHQPPNILIFAAQFFDRQLTMAYGGSSNEGSSFLEKLKTKNPKDDHVTGSATAEMKPDDQLDAFPEIPQETTITQSEQTLSERMAFEPEMQLPGEQQMAQEMIPYGEAATPEQAEVIEQTSRVPGERTDEQQTVAYGLEVSAHEQQEFSEQQEVDMQAHGGQILDQQQVLEEYAQQEMLEEYVLPEAREELAQEDIQGHLAQQELQDGFVEQEAPQEFAQQEVEGDLVQYYGDVQDESAIEMPLENQPFDQQVVHGETNLAEDVPQHAQHYEPVFGMLPDQEQPEAVSNMEVGADNIGVEVTGQVEYDGAEQLAGEVAPELETFETGQGVPPGEETFVDVQQTDVPAETLYQESPYENVEQLMSQQQLGEQMPHDYENVQELLLVDGQGQPIPQEQEHVYENVQEVFGTDEQEQLIPQEEQEQEMEHDYENVQQVMDGQEHLIPQEEQVQDIMHDYENVQQVTDGQEHLIPQEEQVQDIMHDYENVQEVFDTDGHEQLILQEEQGQETSHDYENVQQMLLNDGQEQSNGGA